MVSFETGEDANYIKSGSRTRTTRRQGRGTNSRGEGLNVYCARLPFQG